MSEFVSIKNWIADERPREKLAKKGVQSLSNVELLAILINTGSRQKSAIDIAEELLQKNKHNLLALSQMTLNEIKKVKGIGEKKAVTIMAALELGKRRQLSHALSNPQIASSKDAFEILNPYFYDANQELFYVLYLNQAKKLLEVQKISEGGIAATMVDIRILFRKAIEIPTATNIIICHNHPSGNIQPSPSDKELTKNIKEAGNLMKIQLVDHLIIAGNTYYSFADQGAL
ncbi:MAG: DNA repair protein RadC [Chitinophagaceae bacterium]